MPRQKLTDDWSLELDDSFERRIVDEDAQFVSVGPPTRTVWVAVWGRPEEEAPEDTLAWIMDEAESDPVERFREQSDDGAELRYASWYPAEGERGKQWGLYAYTVRRHSYVQLACLVDDGDSGGRDWAPRTWRSLRFGPQ